MPAGFSCFLAVDVFLQNKFTLHILIKPHAAELELAHPRTHREVAESELNEIKPTPVFSGIASVLFRTKSITWWVR